jgi:hypothetical protein
MCVDFIDLIEIHKFLLRRNDEYPELCPVRHFMRWLHVSGITSGPLFPEITSHDVIVPNSVISATQFMANFREDLAAICVQPTLFGSHSLKRGGTQFLALYYNWNAESIIFWAGWSKNCNLEVINTYLGLDNDDSEFLKETFLDPSQMKPLK